MTTNVYRFKIGEVLNGEIASFARVHRFDDRVSYKEAWAEWVDANQELIEREARRLQESGYTGDVLDKLYKSGRYYYRSRPTVLPPPVERRQYTRVSSDFIKCVDQHVDMHFDNPDVSPSAGFDDFCKRCAVELGVEVELLTKRGLTDPAEVATKLKKCYKNRYFMRREAPSGKDSK
jgi:hypothetical protein